MKRRSYSQGIDLSWSAASRSLHRVICGGSRCSLSNAFGRPKESGSGEQCLIHVFSIQSGYSAVDAPHVSPSAYYVSEVYFDADVKWDFCNIPQFGESHVCSSLQETFTIIWESCMQYSVEQSTKEESFLNWALPRLNTLGQQLKLLTGVE